MGCGAPHVWSEGHGWAERPTGDRGKPQGPYARGNRGTRPWAGLRGDGSRREVDYRGAAPRSLSIPVINEISDSWALTMPWASFFSTPTVHWETQPSAMWTPPL